MKEIAPLYLPAPYQDSPEQGRLILRDGSTASIRQAAAGDAESLREFYRALSVESRKLRFFSESKPGADVLDPLCQGNDPRKIMTLVVTRYSAKAQRIIATGSYIAHDVRTAEFAVAVDDHFHGKGIGGILLERLALLAATHGFTEFFAVTHESNEPMLEVFRNSGFKLSERHEDGYVEIRLHITPNEESVSHSEMRDRMFTKTSIRPFFSPRSVAVIGATTDPTSVGYRIIYTLVAGKFKGPVYPIASGTDSICGITCFPGVASVPEPVDLAVIAVARDKVPGVIDECAAHGIRAVVVLSDGFADAGEDGRRLQESLVEKVRGYGMRMVGPNSLGLINADPECSMNASYSLNLPEFGRISLSSQSGALGLVLLNLARQRKLGLSMFISMGNKADITGNDLLNYWEDDPNTDAILLYLESFGNPRRFARIARRVSRSKPIICVKGGRQGPGEVAAEALFRQTGVIRAGTLEEMFDTAALLGNQPLPRGRRVCIMTNSRGLGVLCRDACASAGLSMARIPDSLRQHLETQLLPNAQLNSFLDLTAAATPRHYKLTLEALMEDRDIDAIITIYAPVRNPDTHAVVQSLHEGAVKGRALNGRGKTLLAVLTTEEGSRTVLRGAKENIPCYLFPETAAHSLALACDYAQWKTRAQGMYYDFKNADTAAARVICQRALEHRSDGWLDESETAALLSTLALPFRAHPSAKRPALPCQVMIGMAEDTNFGPLLSFGLSGSHGQWLSDQSHRITPLTDQDAREMIRAIRGISLLQEQPDHPQADLGGLEECLLRVSLLVEEVPEIKQMSLNPITVFPDGEGYNIVSARVRVEHTRKEQPRRYTISAADAV